MTSSRLSASKAESFTRAVARGQDWGDSPDTTGFVGRAEELETLRTWVLDERSRLVAVVGMAGIGKTSLATRLAYDLARERQWRFGRRTVG